MICKIEGCKKDIRPKRSRIGLCVNHYMKQWHYGDPLHDAKAYLKATKSPSITDLHWMAGFLEGEGHFGMNSPTARCAILKAVQVNKEPLQRIRDVLGGSLKQRIPRNNQQPYYEWNTSGARARGAMMTLYSLLSGVKKNDARLALQI